MAKRNTAPAWRRGFFVRLAACGNATLAARRAGVARGWVYRWRQEDAGFAAEWEAALERFARRRGRSGAGVAARRRRAAAGGGGGAAAAREGRLVVRPMVVRRGRGGRPQLAAARASDWSEAREAVFFAELGATLNVSAASRAAGFAAKTAWARRRVDAAFARRWDAVLDDGAARLELRLMELAARQIGALADEDAAAAEGLAEARALDPDLAKWLLRFRRDGVAKGAARRFGGMRPAPDLDALHAEVMRRIEAMRRHRGPAGLPEG